MDSTLDVQNWALRAANSVAARIEFVAPAPLKSGPVAAVESDHEVLLVR